MKTTRTPPFFLAVLLCVALAGALVSCGAEERGRDHDHDHDPAGHHHEHDRDGEHHHDHEGEPEHAHAHQGHHHSAPNGGRLVPVLDGGANLEVKHDAASGTCELWFHDGCAEKPLRMSGAAPRLVLAGGEAVAFRGVASALSGETAQESSHWRAEGAALKGSLAGATIQGARLLGSEVGPVAWPAGEGE